MAVWPYYLKKKYGLQYCTLPPLTPYLGPKIFNHNDESKNVTRLGQEKKILTELTKQLPKTVSFIAQGSPNWKNWQPLSWLNFKQTTRYTYIIDLGNSEQIIKSQLSDKTRNQISKATDKIEIIKTTDSKVIFRTIKSTFARQGLQVPYSNKFYETMVESLSSKGAINTYSALISEHCIASVTVVNDRTTAYLITTGRSEDAPPGTVGALIWNGILDAKDKGLSSFDFEGSMIQNIESFFRSFGGVQTPYHRISRTPNKWVRLVLEALNRL